MVSSASGVIASLFETLTTAAMNIIPLAGRILFAFIFVASVPGLFGTAAITDAAAHGVPLPALAVPLAGLLALIGGLSVAFGYQARFGAWLLVLFLVPVTWKMHSFWNVPGAEVKQQLTHFMKNIALLGGALLIAHFGAGPLSIDHCKHSRKTAAAAAAGRRSR